MENKKCSLALLMLLSTSSAFAEISIVGGDSYISEYLAEYYNQPTLFYNNQISINNQDAIYVNVAMTQDDDIKSVKSHIIDGKTVILDLESLPDTERIDKSREITGLGVTSELIVTGLYEGELIINSIISDVTDEEGNPINNKKAEQESIKDSLIFALDRLNFGGK